MLWLVIKSLISGALVGIVSETAKRSAAMGALVASLPIVSVLGMVWLWQETKECCQTKTDRSGKTGSDPRSRDELTPFDQGGGAVLFEV